MKINFIEISGFRNIIDEKPEFCGGVNIILGDNAQGKTNLLEAFYLLACGKSHRTNRYRDMILHSASRATVKARVEDEKSEFDLKIVLDKKEGKSIYKNGIRIEKLRQFLGLFRVVLFCPEHLSLIKDGPGERRRFIDAAICQIKPFYASILNEYNKICNQRHSLLKQIQENKTDSSLISVWDASMARTAAKIFLVRREYIKKLSEYSSEFYAGISGENESLRINYVTDISCDAATEREAADYFLQLLKQNLNSDLKYGYTTKGVHGDDIALAIEGYPARTFSSQGQQRSAVLALKLAESEISKRVTGEKPCLLLDDVLSELDEKRRAYLTKAALGGQCIITGCDEEDFKAFDSQKKIYVLNGRYFDEKPVS